MRKSFKKRSNQILSVFVLLPFIAQTFVTPLLALDEVLPEIQVEEDISETEVDIPIDTSEDILEEGISDPEEIAKPIWVTTEGSATTFSPVVLGEKYVYPHNSDVTVVFSSLPEVSGTLTIKTVYLTDEQVKATNAASNVAYDITTDMVDGTFNYDLTLPKVGESNTVVYAESVNELVDAKDITNVIENESSLKIEDLDHFTVFAVAINDGGNKGTTSTSVANLGEAGDRDMGEAINSNALPDTVWVDDDYSASNAEDHLWEYNAFNNIQGAINAVAERGTIHVASGTYNENIIISKLVSLVGENKGTTSISGSGTGVVVTITANNVTLKNFTIKKSGSDLNLNAGIGLAHVTSVIIENNIITDNVIGIAVMGSSSNNINNNEIKNSARYGIVLEEYPTTPQVFSISNTISGNTLTSNARDGIYVGEECNGNTITNNSISGAMGTTESTGFEANGIYFWRSSSNIVTGNTIFNNINYGIEMHGSSSNTITGNTIRNNQDGFHIKNIVETTGYSIKDNNISNNKIYDNTRVNLYADPNFIFNIEKNWWGSPDKAAIISKFASWDASGDFVIPGTIVNLDFDPWCASSDCNIFSNTVLSAPTNLTPVDGTYTNNPAFDNTWSPVLGAIRYEYQTSNTLNGGNLGAIIYNDNSTSGNYNITENLIIRHNSGAPQGTYYWQVRAISADGTPGAWSVINKVVVDTTAPNTPIHTSPDDDKYINYNDFWFDWSDVSDAVSYEIQNSTNPSTSSDGSFTTVMWTGDYQHIQPTTSKSRSVGANGTWYWQVMAIDAAGNKSAWSTPWKITIDTTSPVGGELTMTTTLFPSGITIANPDSNGIYLLPDLSMDGVDVFQSLKVVVTDTNLDTTNVPVYIDGNSNSNGYMAFDIANNIWNYGGQLSRPNFSLGTHNLVATFKDKAGNNKQLTVRFTTDNTAPLITVNNFITSDNTPQITGAINDNTASISVKIGSNTFSATNNNNGTWTLADNTITPALAGGTYDVIATATDTAGNSSTDTTTGELIIDATAPQINELKYYKNGNLITTPSTTPIFVKSIDDLTYGAGYQDNLGLNRTAFVIWDATDTWNPVSNSHKCNWNGSSSTTILNSSTSQTLSEVPLKKCNPSYSWPSGKYIISHVVYDNVGNYSYNTGGSQRFIIDNIAPSVSFTGQTPENESYVKGNITGHVTATDNVGMGSYYIRIWKNAFESGTENLVKECHSALGGDLLGNSQEIDCSFSTTTVSNGKYVLSAQFLDSSSNWGTVFRTFYVDNTIPTVTIKIGTGINDGSLGSNNVYSRISFKLNDPNGGLASVVLNGHTYPRTGVWNDLNWTNITKSHLIEGLNTIYAIDRAGNQSIPLEFTIDRVDPDGDIQGIRYTSKDVQYFITNDNTPIIYGTCSDNNGVSKVEVKIDGNIQTPTCNNGNWVSSEFSPLTDGLYGITLTITDLAGNTSTKSQSLIIDTVAPTATHTYFKDGSPIGTSPVVVNNIGQLSFTGNYADSTSGLYWDTFVIFQAQDDGSFAFEQGGKQSYCGWRGTLNTITLSGNTYSFTNQVNFNNCVSTLPNGTYYISHQVFDNATRKDIPEINQYRDVVGLKFTIDASHPDTPTLLSPSNNAFTRGEVLTNSWSDTSTDIDYYIYESYHDEELKDLRWRQKVYGTSKTATNVSDATFWWRVKAVDFAGNESGWGGPWKVTIDNTDPTTPENLYFKDLDNNQNIQCGGYSNTKHISEYWDASVDTNLDHYEYSSYDAPNGSTGLVSQVLYTNSYDTSWWNIPLEGIYGFQVRAVDKAGNMSDWALINSTGIDNSCQIHIDWTAPVITISAYSTDWTNQDIVVTATTNEETLHASSHTFTENGKFDFVATDKAGNTTTKTVTITNIDKTTPTINSMNISNGLLTVASTDTISNVKSVEVQINGGTWTPYTSGMNLYSLVSNVPGTYTVSVRVTDNANNQITDDTSFTIPEPQVLGATTGPTPKKSTIYYAQATNTNDIEEENTTDETEMEVETSEEEVLGETTCEATYKISGTIYYDKNNNGKYDEDEKVVEGIEVNIYNDKDELVKTVTTDDKGYWEVSLCPGEYTTQVEGAEDQTVVLGASDTTLDVSVKEPTNWLLIVLIGLAVLILLGVIVDRSKKKKEI